MAPRYDAAFFEGQAARSLVSARTVLSRVFPLLHPRRLLDVGCGVGTWLYAALELGAEDVVGTDGNYIDPKLRLLTAISSSRRPRDGGAPAGARQPGGPAIRLGHVHGSRRTPAERGHRRWWRS